MVTLNLTSLTPCDFGDLSVGCEDVVLHNRPLWILWTDDLDRWNPYAWSGESGTEILNKMLYYQISGEAYLHCKQQG